MQFTPYSRYGTLLFSWDLPTERGIGKVVRFVVFSIVFLFRKRLNKQYGKDFDILFFFAFIGNTLSNLFSHSMLLFRLFFPFITCNIMLYSILFGIMCILLPIMSYLAFIEGMKCAKSDVKVPNLPKIRKKPKQTAENARLNDILSNIEAYDGTSNGQKEIK